MLSESVVVNSDDKLEPGDLVEINISDIAIGERYRKEMGDLEPLARNIADLGQLQPIGIMPDRRLIFGERRLKACRDVLGRGTILARVIDLPSVIEGEHAENMFREQFTFAERMKIGLALDKVMEERRGRPSTQKKNVRDGAHFSPSVGQKKRDFLAEVTGFRSGTEFDRAKKIVTDGHDQIQKWVDEDRLAITPAAEFSALPKDEQERIVKRGSPQSVREKVAQMRAAITQGSTSTVLPSNVAEIRADVGGDVSREPRSRADGGPATVTDISTRRPPDPGKPNKNMMQLGRENLPRPMLNPLVAAVMVLGETRGAPSDILAAVPGDQMAYLDLHIDHAKRLVIGLAAAHGGAS